MIPENPVTPLFDDFDITEILVNRFDQIWFEKSGRLFPSERKFESALAYQFFLDRLCLVLGVEVSFEKPAAEGQYQGFRVQMISDSITQSSTGLSLRRLGGGHWDFAKLVASGFLNSESQTILMNLLKSQQSLLIVGETGCGKTTLLNAMTDSLPENERVVFLEDTDELKLKSPSGLKLLTRKGQVGGLSEVTLTDLLKFSLRLRPDRLVVGEVRGPEAKDLLLALSTGHAGSLGTLHASSGHQALLRLEMLVQLGAPQWSLQTVRRLISLSLNGVVVLGKNKKGLRGLKKIEMIRGCEETGLLLETVFEQENF